MPLYAPGVCVGAPVPAASVSWEGESLPSEGCEATLRDSTRHIWETNDGTRRRW